MDSAVAETVNVTSNVESSVQEEKGTNAAEGEKKEKLTKAEKKLKFSTQEPVTTWRELLKALLSPVEKIPRAPEEEKEATELAESVLSQIFGEVENPYKAAFEIYDVFSDREKYKRLHKCLFKTFEEWIQKCSTPEKKEKWLTKQFKVETMEKIVKKGTGQLENLLKIFHLKEADVTNLVNEKIQDLCKSSAKQQFGEAMKLAHHFDLHDNFNIELFIIPQILRNKQDDVEKFVKGHRAVTLQLIRFLDSMIEESDKTNLSILQPYVDRCILTDHAAYTFVNSKKKIPNMLKKLTSSEYGMDESAAPRYESKKIKDKLRYLLFDRDSTDGSFTTTIFDHVKTHVKKGSRTSRDVIIALFDRIDKRDKHEDKATYYTEAEMWMLYYELNPRDFFAKIENYFNSNPGWQDRAAKMLEKYDSGNASCSGNKLSDGTPIEWIDNWKEVQEMLTEIEGLETDSMIGIDSEFRSTTNNKQEIALLQVSSKFKVYLIDFETLHKYLSVDEWNTFTKRLFGGNHMKIGFDMLSDIKAYQCTIPFLSEDLQKSMTRVICLKRLTNDLLDIDKSIIDLSQSTSWKYRIKEGKNPAEDQQRAIKLSDLVEVVLNMELDKTLQKSNWSMRPLRQEQLIYAATDANILIKLYIEFGELAKNKGCNYEDMVKSIENDLAERKNDVVEKKKKAKMTEEEYAQLVKEINDAAIAANGDEDSPKSFITDSSFAGLGKHLRRLGVDVIFATSKEELLQFGKAPENASRIILSYGKNLTEYKQVFGTRIFPVGIGLTPKKQVIEVLTSFKMKLSPSDVFTRCMLCNGDQFVMVPSIVLQTLHDCAAKRGNENVVDDLFDPFPFKEKIEQANPDDYGGFECTLMEFEPEDTRFIVKCVNGVVDIYNNIVTSDFLYSPAEIQTLRVQPVVVESDRPFYYLCGSCGKVYWDGTHGKRYKEFVDGVVGTEVSVSNLSLNNN